MATFEKIAKRLMVKEPFYGLFLLSLNKQETKDIPTLGVCLEGINHKLLINPEFWDKQTDDQQLALLKHELMHICFKHTTQLYKDLPQHKMANVAMDCEINQNIPNLPEGGVSYEKMKADGCPDLEPKAGSRYYYKYMLNKANKSGGSGGGGGGFGHLLNDPKGNQNPNKGTGDPNQQGSHDMWKDFEELSDAEKELVEQQVDYVVKNTAEQVQKMRGTLPGELAEYIGKLLAPKAEAFNWKAYFRRLIGNAVEFYKKSTRKKPSKRFDDAPGFRHIHKHKILVAIDTSGSVSNKELLDFFNEIGFIYKAGAGIDVLEYDTKVNKVWQYKGKAPDQVTGRGGTWWSTSAYQYYKEHAKEYSAFVTFTDGYDNFQIDGPRGNFIFVITSDGAKSDYPGKAVYIPKEVKEN